MQSLTLIEWSALAQVILTIVTAIGIIVSLYMSRKTLREIQTDRLLKQKPHLAFEGGGMRMTVEFLKKGKGIPGVNSEYAKMMFSNLPDNAESVRLKDKTKENGQSRLLHYGRLRNFGLGPALEARVTWVPVRIKIGSETFQIDNGKRDEPRYRRELNEMPAIPEHIFPGSESVLSRLPTFIEKDFEKKISEVDGVLEITCEDVFGKTHTTHQNFYIKTNYTGENPYVHVTFKELAPNGVESEV